MSEPMKEFLLAIDQGTSSTKAIVFDHTGRAIAKGTAALKTDHFPNGFVEQDAIAIYQNVLEAVRQVLNEFRRKGFNASAIKACGISNQRETFILWDQHGNPLTPAVVWACKRSVKLCKQLKEKGQEPMVRERTGLIIDPYFSATKLLWLLENDAHLRSGLEAGNVYFGTVDSWLLYKMTGGEHFRTDYTNACRTLLFNIQSLKWDEEILQLWGLEKLNLPEVCPSSFHFGETDLNGLLPAPLPVTALIGDSHAAAFGESCFKPGMAKITLGTGSSILMNTGDTPVFSSHGMLTTICWSTREQIAYALEGAIVACGSTLEWLKNELHLFDQPADTEQMATTLEGNGGVYLIPAFSGLGAPHWQMDRKASIHGMTFGTTKAHIVRAALESIPYQVKDVIEAIRKDMTAPLQRIAVNGGIAGNEFVIKFLADLLQLPLSRQFNTDISAAGAAYLAGLETGLFQDLDALAAIHQQQSAAILPEQHGQRTLDTYRQWQRLVQHP